MLKPKLTLVNTIPRMNMFISGHQSSFLQQELDTKIYSTRTTHIPAKSIGRNWLINDVARAGRPSGLS